MLGSMIFILNPNFISFMNVFNDLAVKEKKIVSFNPCSKRRRKTARSSLKPYKPRWENAFNNYIIILITIRLLNKQNNSFFKY